MGIILMLSWMLKRKTDTINNVAISCLIIIIINPYSIYNLGFQLSYGGTLGIIYYYESVYNFIKTKTEKSVEKVPILSKLIKYIISTISVSISANIVIMPILMYYTNKISFVFIISNLLVSFLFEVILFLSFFIVIISFISNSFAKFLVPLLENSIKILNLATSFSSQLSKYDILISTPSILTLICIYLLIFLFRNTIFTREKSKKLIKIVIVSYIIINITVYFSMNIKAQLSLYFIDVGQGDSTLIITQENKKILIDGGGSNVEYDVGENVLLPYLLDRKIMKIDYIIISHFDSDHCKGIFTILNKLKVKNVCISKKGQESENYNEFMDIVKNKKINVILVKQGDKICIDKYTYISVLWPGEEIITDNGINNYSIVFKLMYNQYSILFTGDIEKVAEQSIIRKYDNR